MLGPTIPVKKQKKNPKGFFRCSQNIGIATTYYILIFNHQVSLLSNQIFLCLKFMLYMCYNVNFKRGILQTLSKQTF